MSELDFKNVCSKETIQAKQFCKIIWENKYRCVLFIKVPLRISFKIWSMAIYNDTFRVLFQKESPVYSFIFYFYIFVSYKTFAYQSIVD